MNDTAPHFSQTHVEARRKFVDALAAHAVQAAHHVHASARGRGGEELAMDCALIGPTDLELGLPPVMDNDEPKHVA
jgi:hypothetical protein